MRLTQDIGALTKLGITHVLSIGAKMLASDVDADAGIPYLTDGVIQLVMASASPFHCLHTFTHSSPTKHG